MSKKNLNYHYKLLSKMIKMRKEVSAYFSNSLEWLTLHLQLPSFLTNSPFSLKTSQISLPSSSFLLKYTNLKCMKIGNKNTYRSPIQEPLISIIIEIFTPVAQIKNMNPKIPRNVRISENQIYYFYSIPKLSKKAVLEITYIFLLHEYTEFGCRRKQIQQITDLNQFNLPTFRRKIILNSFRARDERFPIQNPFDISKQSTKATERKKPISKDTKNRHDKYDFFIRCWWCIFHQNLIRKILHSITHNQRCSKIQKPRLNRSQHFLPFGFASHHPGQEAQISNDAEQSKRKQLIPSINFPHQQSQKEHKNNTANTYPRGISNQTFYLNHYKLEIVNEQPQKGHYDNDIVEDQVASLPIKMLQDCFPHRFALPQVQGEQVCGVPGQYSEQNRDQRDEKVTCRKTLQGQNENGSTNHPSQQGHNSDYFTLRQHIYNSYIFC